jgi:hypothetical protein
MFRRVEATNDTDRLILVLKSWMQNSGSDICVDVDIDVEVQV